MAYEAIVDSHHTLYTEEMILDDIQNYYNKIAFKEEELEDFLNRGLTFDASNEILGTKNEIIDKKYKDRYETFSTLVKVNYNSKSTRRGIETKADILNAWQEELNGDNSHNTNFNNACSYHYVKERFEVKDVDVLIQSFKIHTTIKERKQLSNFFFSRYREFPEPFLKEF